MFQGLLPYEIILMVFGVIVLAVAIFLVVWNSIKNKPISPLISLFVIGIVLVGWPGIQSVSYDDGKIEIQKMAQQLTTNPADTALQNKLEKSVAAFDTTRAKKDPAALTTISTAYYALGKYDDADKFNKKALVIDPKLQSAVNLKSQIATQVLAKNNYNQKIQQLTNSLQSVQPGKGVTNADSAKKIATILNETKPPVYTDEKSSLVIAKSLASVNNKAKSLDVVNKVLAANPQSLEALQLKKDIVANKFATAVADSTQVKNVDIKKFSGVIKRAAQVKQ